MKPLYAFSRACLWLVLKTGGIRVLGRENIPEDKSILLICNHVSYGDPPALCVAFPRQITFIAKEAFGRNIWTRALFGALGAVFLSKDDNDLVAMRTTIRELKNGGAVAIFPEGGRHLNQVMGEFKPGAAYIAARAGVRVLPMAVVNSGDFWRVWKRNIVVNIGPPLETETPERISEQFLAERTQLYRQRVEELFEEACALLRQEGRKMRVHD